MKLRSILMPVAVFPFGVALSTSLQAEDIILSPQVVTGEAVSGAERHPGTVDRVTAEDIARSGAGSVQEVLQNLPGIYLQKSGNVAQDAPNIRGLSAEQILVLIDGKRVPNTDRNLSFEPAYRYNWVPVSQIERVEVLRGPAAALYGAGAMAGVINIVTKTSPREWSTSVDGGLEFRDGDQQSYSLGAAFSGPLGERADLDVAVSKQSEDPILSDDGTTGTSGLSSRTLNTRLGIDLTDRDRLELGARYGEDDASVVGLAHGSGLSTTRLEQERRLFSADYLTRLGGFDLRMGVSQGRTDLLEGTSDWEVDEDNYELELNGRLGELHRLTTGVHHRRERVARHDLGFDDDVSATTLTLQDGIDLTPAHSLTLGVAFDHHSSYSDETSPSLYWNWDLGSGWGVKAGYGEGYMAPGLSKATSDYTISAGPTRRYEGNDDIEPETNAIHELGISYSGTRWESQVTLFHNRIDNLIAIEESQEGVVTVAQYVNVDEAMTQGVEAELGFRPGRNSRIRINYTWLESENRSGENRGNVLVDTPEHLVKLVAEHTLPRLGSTLFGAWRYTGSQYTDSANADKLSAYHIVDLGVTHPLTDRVRMRLGLNNLFNKTVESGGEFLESGRELALHVSADF